MNEKVYKVIKGYSNLSYTERKEVREFIEKYEKEEFKEREPLVKALSESVGPIHQDTCPCCGK